MWDKKVGVIPRSLCRPRLVGEPGDHRNKRYQEERNLVSLLEPLRDPRSDEELIVAFANGDVAAFDAIYLRYEDSITNFHAIRWPREAEEMTQETFIRIVRFAGKYSEAKGKFRPWLYGVATRAQYDYCRQHLMKWAKIRLIDDVIAGDPAAAKRLEPVQPTTKPEDIILARQLLATLRAIDREIVFLYVEGYTDAEIAEILNHRRPYLKLVNPYSPKGIATRRRRALKALGGVEK
jgi:RNA polymerase sigma-70 factor (ECF subfamily)